MKYSTIFWQARLHGVLAMIVMLGVCLWAGMALGQEIEASHKYAWSENTGWQNWTASDGQATVLSDHLTGFVWAENIGWIKLGADAGGPYDNTTATNWGINRDGAGDLSGYAWSETAGWINFNSPSGGGASIDPATGDFSGYAWGENIGWIKLAGTAQDSIAYKVKMADTAPTITTQAVTDIGTTTATGNGIITSLGIPNPTAHGVCWATTTNPTTEGTCANNGAATATGAFTASMTGLTPGTTYYARAYATNDVETVYGEEVEFISLTTTPDPFSFTAQTNVPRNSESTSNTITVSGINAPSPISITSCTGTNCEYAINGGAWTAIAGTVENGNTVQVRQTSSGSYSTQTNLTLDIGGVTNTFSVMTEAAPSPVNGQCGSADGQAFISAPSSDLCSSGTASSVSGDGPWSWTCQGSNGGSNASCSAEIQAYTVTASSGDGGSISPSSRNVTHGSSTTFTVSPDVGYSIDSVSGCSGYVANVNNPNTTVTMPAEDISIQAVYMDKPAERFNLSVGSGTGGGEYEAGQTVSISANPPADNTLIFDAWSGQTAHVVNISDPNTFVIMPEDNVSVTAVYRDREDERFILTVTSGTGSGDFEPGHVASIAASPADEGMVFDQWTGNVTSVANIYNPNTSLNMPGRDITVRAIYKDDPGLEDPRELKVNHGTGNGNYLPGRVVSIAAELREGFIFDRWVGQISHVTNVNIPNTSVIMPDTTVVVNATFKPDPNAEFRFVRRTSVPVVSPQAARQTQSNTVKAASSRRALSNTASVASEGILVPAGRLINLIAPDAPAGYTFDKWIGQTAHVSNIHQPRTLIFMPDHDVDVTATYRRLTDVNLIVENGSGSGAYISGEAVSITAVSASENMMFDKWEGQTAGVVNINRASTTIVLAGTDARIRAVYRERPEDE